LEIINLDGIELVSFDDEVLVKGRKGGMQHGYYTHLIPKKIRGKDGVERIHWINPDPTKAPKLRLVEHHNVGKENEHLKGIEREHGIESKDLVRYGAGDKVEVVDKAGKASEGIFRGSVASESNMTPRVSVAVKSPKTDKWQARTVNVNDIRLVHRATEETKAAIKKKTIEVETRSGGLTRVDTADYEKYYADASERNIETPEEQHELLNATVALGSVYTRLSDGIRWRVDEIRSKTDSEPSKVLLQAMNPAKDMADSKRRMTVQADAFKRALIDGQFRREPGNTHADLKTQPLSAALERGLFLNGGDYVAYNKGVHPDPAGGPAEIVYTPETRTTAPQVKFDENGKFQWVNPEEGRKLAGQIIAENLKAVKSAAYNAAARYSNVSKLDAEGMLGEVYEPLLGAILTYEPLIGDSATGIEGRLRTYAGAYARDYARAIHDRKVLEDQDWGSEEDGPTLASYDKEPDAYSEEQSLVAAPFVHSQDAMVLEEGLKDEADLLDWLYGNSYTATVMSKWMGLGKFEATLTKKEAAQALYGHLVHEKTRLPVALSTIETEYLPKQRERIISALKVEAYNDPNFEATMALNLRLRDSMRQKRANKEDEIFVADKPILEEAAEGYNGEPKVKAKVAAELIKLGVGLKDSPRMVQVVDQIFTGHLRPSEYALEIPKKYVSAVDKVVGNFSGGKIKVKDVIMNGISVARKAKADYSEVAGAAVSKGLVVDGYEIIHLWGEGKTWEMKSRR
jgi:hypothetical protein